MSSSKTGEELRRTFRPSGLATGIGSLPHADPAEALKSVLEHVPEFPFWPQLPRRSPLEGMTLQYLEGFPALRDLGGGRDPIVDTSGEAVDELEAYYARVLSDDLDAFKISRKRAEGFYTFEEAIVQKRPSGMRYLKGHVTGPVTLATTLRDPRGREIAYDDTFREVVATFVGRKARWQARRLQSLGVPVVIFLDEPVMEVYGSAYSALTEEIVNALWTPSLVLLREIGVLSGIHCCGNTDWDLVFRSGVDIVNFDAYHYLDRMLLYPEALHRYLGCGGCLAWGLVPTSEEAQGLDADSLLGSWDEALARFRDRGLEEERLRAQCLITPSCGMGSLDPALAERILGLLSSVSRSLRDRPVLGQRSA